MPNASVIIPGKKLIYVRYSGIMRKQDILEDFARLQHDPDFDPDLPSLNDMGDATVFEGGFSQIAAIISDVGEAYAQHNSRLKIAIYAPRDVPFGMSRIYESLADLGDAIDAAVFREFDQAAAFLGRSEKTREKLFENTGLTLPEPESRGTGQSEPA